MFVKAFSKTSPITCFKVGHKVFECNNKKIGHIIVKQTWIPKRIIASNTKGSEKARILKLEK